MDLRRGGFGLGMVMPVIPHRTACLRCYSPYPGGTLMSCETTGVIAPAPAVIASLQCAAAMKILVGSRKIRRRDCSLSMSGTATLIVIAVNPRADCPACSGKYEFLEGEHAITYHLIMRGGVQILTKDFRKIDFAAWPRGWSRREQ